MNNSIIMNDSMSILLATTILALGGFGLYMYKSSDDSQKGGDEPYSEDSLFNTSDFFGLNSSENDEEDIKKDEHEEDVDTKPRKKSGKTLRTKKNTGSSRRRY